MSVAETPDAEAAARRPAELVAWVRRQVEAKDAVRRAVDRFHAGRFDEALLLFEEALGRGADGTTLTDYLTDCHLIAGRYSDAVKTLEAKVAAHALANIAVIGWPYELDRPSLRLVHAEPILLTGQTLHESVQACGNQ